METVKTSNEYFGSKAKLLTEKAAALQAQAVAAKTQADAYQAQANAATDPTAKLNYKQLPTNMQLAHSRQVLVQSWSVLVLIS